MDEQLCIKCNKTKPLADFYFRKDSQKYRTDCKACVAAHSKARYNNPEVRKAISERGKQYRAASPVVAQDAIRKHERYASDPLLRQRIKEYNKQYHATHKRTTEQNRTQRLQYRERFGVRFMQAVAKAICRGLSARAMFIKPLCLLPYSFYQLREHIERQFTPEMTWDNYGTYWTLDHIIPQSQLRFDCFEHPNFQICWALSNLRPLKKEDNYIRRYDSIVQSLFSHIL